MTDSERTKEFRDNLGVAFDRAYAALLSERSATGLLELYDHRLITSMEGLNYVWHAFYDDDIAREVVCKQLLVNSDDSIRGIPAIFGGPGFRQPKPD